MEPAHGFEFFSPDGKWVAFFAWPKSLRKVSLAQDGALLGRLTRMVVETVLAFHAACAAQEDGPGAKTGAVSVVQRTSSDLRLNPARRSGTIRRQSAA